MGGIGGEDKVTLTIEELPNHQHEYYAAHDFNSVDDGKDRNHGFNRHHRRRFSGDINSHDTGLFHPDDVKAAVEADGRNPKPSARQTGQPHSNLPPYMVVNYIIKI